MKVLQVLFSLYLLYGCNFAIRNYIILKSPCLTLLFFIPVVLHEAVAEVSRIGNL